MQLFTLVSPNPNSLSFPLSFFSFQPPCRALYCTTLATLQKMAKIRPLPNLPPTLRQRPTPQITCSSCAAAKQQPALHQTTTHRYRVGEALGSDICGSFNPPSRQGNKYILTVFDTGSRYLIVDFLKPRADTPHRLDRILTALKQRNGCKPRLIHTENAKEYISEHANTMYPSHNVMQSTKVPHTPQQNLIAERINALMNSARAALHHSGLPKTHWEDAVRDTALKYNNITPPTTCRTQWGPTPPPEYPNNYCSGSWELYQNWPIEKISKLAPRATTARYLHAIDEHHIMVPQTETYKLRRV